MTQTDHNRLPLSHRPLPLLVKEIMSSVVSLCENLFGKYLALRSVPKPNKPGQTKYVATNIFETLCLQVLVIDTFPLTSTMPIF